MKQLLSVLFLVPVVLFAQEKHQYNYGFLKELFFMRQPSARAEAMGRSYVLFNSDLSSAFYNPAGIGMLEGAQFYASGTEYRTGNKDEALRHNFYAAGSRIGEHFAFGLSNYTFVYDMEGLPVWSPDGEVVNNAKNTLSNYTLTLAGQPVHDLFIGLNVNYLTDENFFWDYKESAVHTDLGVHKRFRFGDEAQSHQLDLAVSMSNFTLSKVRYDYGGQDQAQTLPATGRYGAGYRFSFWNGWISPDLRTLEVSVQAEFQDLANAEQETALRGGLEVSLFEILKLRCGYYSVKQFYNPSYPQDEKYSRSRTYGIGIQLPIDRLVGVPLMVQFDLAVMPEESFTIYGGMPETFRLWNLHVTWLLRGERKERKEKE
jgi:hypothetical protein